jgi:hypothetical protein
MLLELDLLLVVVRTDEVHFLRAGEDYKPHSAGDKDCEDEDDGQRPEVSRRFHKAGATLNK